jgi:predicted metal-dependent hydrolase
VGVSAGGLEAERSETDYEQLVSRAFSIVAEWLGTHPPRSGVVVLAPSGCSRAELLKRLLKMGQHLSKAYVYKGFRDKVREVEQGVEEYESLDKLSRELKSRRGELVAVVPESSCDAVMLKYKLERELPGARVELLYLPKLHSKATKELPWLSRDAKRLARVEHRGLKDAYKCEAKGYSPTLLRAWRKEELEELKRAKKAVLGLSPDRLGLKDYLVEATHKMLIALTAVPFGVAVALAVDQLLRNLASLNLHGAIQKLLGSVGTVSAEPAEGFASRILEGWSRPEARNKVAEGLAKLVVAAREAAPHLDREELETVVDQVALEWGMDVLTFKVFVKNLAKLASGEVVTSEELRKELEKLVGKELEERLKQLIEKRLKEIEEKMKELQESVEGLKIGARLFYAHELEAGLLYPNFKVEKGRPVIASREERGRVEAELVTVGPFEKLTEETLSRMEKGLVVLEGPKGVGKSTLATYTVWLALLKGRADAVLQVIELERGESLSLERLAESLKGRILALYDPSPLPTYYEPGAFAGEARKTVERVEETLQELLNLAERGNRVIVLTVLPSDLYNEALSLELKEKLKPFTMHVILRDPQFLEEVIKKYSGCTGSFEELAEAIARFEGGYTLVAKYAGLTLREKKCSMEDVQAALREAKGRPKLFLAHYLWSVLLKGSENYARRAAVPLLLHSAFGPVPKGITYLTAASRERPWRFLEPSEIEEKRFQLQDLKDEELEPVAKWLSVQHEDLMEEMLEELCGFKGGEARKLYAQHLPKLAGYQQGTDGEQGVLEWALNKVIDEAHEAGISKPDEALLQFTGERLTAALKAYTASYWRRLALIAGFAFADYPLFPRMVATETHFVSETRETGTIELDKALPSGALKPCEADSYLLVDGEIPSLVVRVVLQRPSVLAHPLAHWHGEAAKELEKLVETWRSRGGMYLSEAFYGLGLALAVAGAFELGESVEAREAEAALYTATSALQQVLIYASAAVILDSFRRLGGLAPHYYVLLASATSELLELKKETAHKITEFLEEALEREELKVRGWPLVEAVSAYSNLVTKHREHFLGEEERLRERMCKLLEWLEGQLRDIAEVYTLQPALEQGLKPCGGADPAGRAEELLKRLEEMEKEESSGQAAEWATVLAFKPEGFKLLVKHIRGTLTFSLAWYKMDNEDLEAARKLFTVSAEIYRELEDQGNYWLCRLWAACCSVLGAESLEELIGRARAFEKLWGEAKKQETLEMAYLQKESSALAGYLVFLALEDRKDEVSKLLVREEWLLQLFPKIYVTTRLLLELLGVGVGKPEALEVAIALSNDINGELRPIFFDTLSGAIHGDRETAFLQGFREWLGEEVDKQSWSNDSEGRETIERFYHELLDFVDRRGASAVVQLLAPLTSRASFTLMLWALVNGDEELARAYTKLTWILSKRKLLRRLFREAAEAWSEEELKLALLKLFYLHF